MKISNIKSRLRSESAIHGESIVSVPHWDFDVNGIKFHAFPHYSGRALIVSTIIQGETWYLSPDGPHKRKEEGGANYLPHTPETEFLAALNYGSRDLAAHLGGGEITDPLEIERPDNTPWMKGDDQPEIR